MRNEKETVRRRKEEQRGEREGGREDAGREDAGRGRRWPGEGPAWSMVYGQCVLSTERLANSPPAPSGPRAGEPYSLIVL